MTESKGVLNVGTLTAGGVSAPAIALLKKQGVETLDQVEGFEPHVWSHLFASGLTVADHRALMGMLKKFQKRPIPIPPPPNLAFNVGSLLLGLVFAVPSIVIGVFNEYGTYTAARPLTTPESLLLVLLPGALYLIGNVILIERFRGIFSTDVLKQRSDGVSIREAEKSGVTNMAVVAALLLTIIIGAGRSRCTYSEPASKPAMAVARACAHPKMCAVRRRPRAVARSDDAIRPAFGRAIFATQPVVSGLPVRRNGAMLRCGGALIYAPALRRSVG